MKTENYAIFAEEVESMERLKIDIWPPQNSFYQIDNYSFLQKLFDVKEMKSLRGRRIIERLGLSYDLLNGIYIEFQRRKKTPLILLRFTHPFNLKPPYIVFFYDFFPWRKELAYGEYSPKYNHRGIIRLAIHSDKILTLSFYSREIILKIFRSQGYEISNKIDVIYPFVDFNIFSNSLIVDEILSRKIDRNTENTYKILFVGNDEFRKNHTNAIISTYLVNKMYNLQADLIIVTKRGPRFNEIDTIAKLYCKKLGRCFINIRSRVPVKELADLYSNSDLMLYISFEEGFGLPSIEAQASGLPVVASNVSCIPEVLSDSAYYVDPYDPLDISNAIYKVLTDKNLYQSLVKKSIDNARKYSTERFMKKLYNIVSEIYDKYGWR